MVKLECRVHNEFIILYYNRICKGCMPLGKDPETSGNAMDTNTKQISNNKDNLKKNNKKGQGNAMPQVDARLWAVLVLVAAFSAAVLRTAAILLSYDAEIGYFARGTALPVLADVVCIIGTLAAVGFAFFCCPHGRAVYNVGARDSAPVYFATAYAAFVMLGTFMHELWRCLSERTAASYFEKAAAVDNAYTARSLRIQGVLIIIGIIASAISAIYFFCRLSGKGWREWYVILGFAPGLRGVSGMATIYFDMTVEMNSPNKMLLQLALISVMLYFLLELRMLLGEKKARPRAYAAVGLAATVLTAAASVSLIAAYFAGQVSNAYFFTESFFCFNMMIYIMVRTVAFIAGPYTKVATVSDAERESAPVPADAPADADADRGSDD